MINVRPSGGNRSRYVERAEIREAVTAIVNRLVQEQVRIMAVHEQLAAGQWQALSLMGQLANVGSDVARAARWYGKNQQRCERLSIVL